MAGDNPDRIIGCSWRCENAVRLGNAGMGSYHRRILPARPTQFPNRAKHRKYFLRGGYQGLGIAVSNPIWQRCVHVHSLIYRPSNAEQSHPLHLTSWGLPRINSGARSRFQNASRVARCILLVPAGWTKSSRKRRYLIPLAISRIACSVISTQ